MFTDVWGMDENPAGYDAPPPSSDPNEIQTKKGTDGKDYQWDGQNWRYYPGTVKVTADRIYSVMYNNSSWVTANEKANININPPPATQSSLPADISSQKNTQIETPDMHSEHNVVIDNALLHAFNQQKQRDEINEFCNHYFINPINYAANLVSPSVFSFGVSASGVAGTGTALSVENNYNVKNFFSYISTTASPKILAGGDVSAGGFVSFMWTTASNSDICAELLESDPSKPNFRPPFYVSGALPFIPLSISITLLQNSKGDYFFTLSGALQESLYGKIATGVATSYTIKKP